LETMAIDIKDCERYFNQILGDDVEPDVLDAIFQRFCIGK
jgi:tRNA U34 5-carboxymethylaminomethyl modifying GTPase MnmE/TrmE